MDLPNDAVIESKKCDGTDLNSRVTKLEEKNQHQEVKIEVVQTQLEEERKLSKQLSSRISQLELQTIQVSPKMTNFLSDRNILIVYFLLTSLIRKCYQLTYVVK